MPGERAVGQERSGAPSAPELTISLHRDLFLRNLVRELAGNLERIVGLEEAAGYFSLVGGSIGDMINAEYREAWGQPKLSFDQVVEVLVDLKARIQGAFRAVSTSPERLEFRNTTCPFGDKSLDRPSMCMMTSNVFGVIAASNLGYAKVELRKTIAAGDPECHVIVHLQQTEASRASAGREYFAEPDR